MALISRPTRCFVAMAFGHSDTDAFFERSLLPILRSNDVTPVIINRTSSNDDLNNQIVEQLLAAEFMVCDLTYARPSVYFEAGFAQRAIPVIYTVRQDHLERSQPDDRRVHFDLQMKPLIPWATAADVSFATRFEERLIATLKPLRRDRSAEEALRQMRAEYARLPLSERLVTARRWVILALSDCGYENWHPINARQPFRVESLLAGRIDRIAGVRRKTREQQIATVTSFASLTKVALFDATRMLTHEYMTDLEQSELHHFVLSLRSVPQSRIESVLSTAARQTASSYVETYYNDLQHLLTYWHFVAPITSEIETKQAIKAMIVT